VDGWRVLLWRGWPAQGHRRSLAEFLSTSNIARRWFAPGRLHIQSICKEGVAETAGGGVAGSVTPSHSAARFRRRLFTHRPEAGRPCTAGIPDLRCRITLVIP
jgi:hypothetical protein